MTTANKVRAFYFAPIALGMAVFMACLFAFGCANGLVKIDKTQAFQVFAGGAVGISNDPLKFPKPLVTLKKPFPLAIGTFVVRHDHYPLRDVFVLHQVVGQNPDGSYIMHGYNRTSNPVPDKTPLTAENYVGITFPLTSP